MLKNNTIKIIGFVKINEQKPHLKCSQEARRGKSHALWPQRPAGRALYSSSPNFSSIRIFSPLFFEIFLWFAIRPHVLNCHYSFFPNKLCMLEKYLVVCFKVNIYIFTGFIKKWSEPFFPILFTTIWLYFMLYYISAFSLMPLKIF